MHPNHEIHERENVGELPFASCVPSVIPLCDVESHAQNAVLGVKNAEIEMNTQLIVHTHAHHFTSLHFGCATTVIQSAECTRESKTDLLERRIRFQDYAGM